MSGIRGSMAKKEDGADEAKVGEVPIAPGVFAWLRSGGPRMTVGKMIQDEACCYWFARELVREQPSTSVAFMLASAIFPAAALTTVCPYPVRKDSTRTTSTSYGARHERYGARYDESPLDDCD